MGMFVLKWAQGRIARAWSSDAKTACIWISCLLVLFLSVEGFSRTRDTGAASFSIDLDKPFNEVLSIVDEVARSGSIKGTFEYRGDEQLGGAQFAEKSSLFPARSQKTNRGSATLQKSGASVRFSTMSATPSALSHFAPCGLRADSPPPCLTTTRRSRQRGLTPTGFPGPTTLKNSAASVWRQFPF